MLTNETIRALARTDRVIKKSDGGGLYISVVPKGGARWYIAYRYGGKQKTLSGGKYPEISIDRARVWREEIRKMLENGVDPGICKTPFEKSDSENVVTFEEVACEWMQNKKCDWTDRTARQIGRYFKNDVFPIVGKFAVRSITPALMLEVFQRIESRGATVVSHLVRTCCSEVFRSGIPDGRVVLNPCRDLDVAMKRRPRRKHFARLLPGDFPRFFAALKADQGSQIVHLAIRWTILTMVRSKETRFAQWKEFEDLNSAEPIWRIPAERMKKRNEHIIPLPPQAVKLLREIKALNIAGQAGDKRYGKYLFPSPLSNDGVIAEGSMIGTLKRLDVGDITVHGFRAVASSILNESGLFSPDWIELQLAHEPPGVRGVYNKARYLEHRRKMLIWWASYLDRAETTVGSESLAVVRPQKAEVLER
ncbi:integrase arm-type DNA-binding domain-containing protein [Sphingobium sp. EM0848]|uniref:tyrosine-type recombinase/integrase n=1 Tax=Sphingobium sp. EM0848 TaxID=2743473 RepID=UPI00159C53CC|nr:integrase arm-type DNA-binding domain-containing protein [Sphingobium sp. EM0848]